MNERYRIVRISDKNALYVHIEGSRVVAKLCLYPELIHELNRNGAARPLCDTIFASSNFTMQRELAISLNGLLRESNEAAKKIAEQCYVWLARGLLAALINSSNTYRTTSTGMSLFFG